MVQGVVNDEFEAVISLSILSPSGHSREIEAVIDTGFNRFLFLPSFLVSELSLEFAYDTPVVFADGSEERLNVFNVIVMWDGSPRKVEAIASTGMSLVGMRMLEDHDLHVEVREGGKVLIETRG